MGEIYKDLWKRVIGRYSWKVMELISVLVLARLFLPLEFGYAFIVITLVSLAYPFFILKEAGKQAEEYDNLHSFSVLCGVIGALIILIASYFFGDRLHLPFMLRFSGLFFLLSMLTVVPISYYTSEKKLDKIYKANLISQIVMLGISILLFFFNLGYQAILYGYLMFWLVKLLLLWPGMGIKVNVFSFDINIIKKFNFRQSAIISILKYGILVLTPLFFGVENFSYLYMAFYLGFFLYENITVFLSKQLLPLFKGYLENRDLFNLNLVRVLEYFSFVIMPFTIIPLLLFKDILLFIFGENWQIYDLFFILIITGVAKSIFEIPNIVLMAKGKQKVVQRIRIFDIICLVLFAPVLGKFLGLFGIVLAVLISSLLSSLLFMIASLRSLKLNIIGVSKDYFYIIFSAILTSLSLGLLKEWFSPGGFLAVFILWIKGVTLFILSIYLINKDFLKRFVRFSFSMIGEEQK
jgi:O-antigen/teichoic acid export membrane protein